MSAHIQLSAAIESVGFNRVSAVQKQAKTVLQEVWNDNFDDDNIPLAKLSSNSWSDGDSDVLLRVLR